jgi:hypothetical protein
MTWTTRILAMLNIIAAGVLAYFGSESYYARAAWNKAIEARIEQRDGIPTDRILEKLKSAKPDDYKRIVEQHYSRIAIESTTAIGKNPDTAEVRDLNSDATRRKEAAGVLSQQWIETPGLALAQEAETLSREVGINLYSRLLRDFFKFTYPKLKTEELAILQERETQTAVQEKLTKNIAEKKAEIERFETELAAEKVITGKITADIAERQRELTRLYAELEESVAARNTAEARKRDFDNLLSRTRAEYQEYQKKNKDTEDEIRRREAGAGSRGQ